MNKSMGLILSATLLTSTLTTVNAEAKTIYKIKKGILVNAKTDKVVKGFKNYKGKLYKNGKLFKGVYKDKRYNKGKLINGIYNKLRYENGKVFTGIYEGLKYKKGILFTGISNKIKYVDGKEEMIQIEEYLFYKSETQTYHGLNGDLITNIYLTPEAHNDYVYFFTNEGKLDSKWTIKEYEKYNSFAENLYQTTSLSYFDDWRERKYWNDSGREKYENLIDNLPEGKLKKEIQEKAYDITEKNYNNYILYNQNKLKEPVQHYIGLFYSYPNLENYIEEIEANLSIISNQQFVSEYRKKLKEHYAILNERNNQ